MHGWRLVRHGSLRHIGPGVRLGRGTKYEVRRTSVAADLSVYLDPRRHDPVVHRRSRDESSETLHESLLEPRPRPRPLVADRDEHVAHHALHVEAEPGEDALQ